MKTVRLAPLAGVTDWPFRLLCFEQGCDCAYTEMVSAMGYRCAPKGQFATEQLLVRHPEEKKLMKEAGVTAFTMSDIDRQGFATILQKVTDFFKTRVDSVHVSFDMDVIDPMFAPGVGIPLPGGLNYREALLLMEEMADTKLVLSAEFVEVNPVLDVRSQTARMAVELMARLLGDTIY